MEGATREERLHGLLLSMFNGEELERFVRLGLPEASAFVAALPPANHVPPATFVDAMVRQLVQHGLVGDLFRLLHRDFTRRADEIAAVETLWIGRRVPPTSVAWTWSDELLTLLTKSLARRVRKEDDVMAAIADAGIDISAMTLRPSAADRWSSVLERARRQGKVSRLIAAVQRRHGVDRELSHLVDRAMRENASATHHETPKRTLARPPLEGTIVMSSEPQLHVPLWRGTRLPDQLMFFPPEDGFIGLDQGLRHFPLALGREAVAIGRVAGQGELRNDFVLPHGTVSAAAITLLARDGRAIVRRRPECRNAVRVDSALLQAGDEIRLHHGQRIMIGKVQGVFVDGRFTRYDVEPAEIDPDSGLLAREGFVLELAQAIRRGNTCQMLLIRAVGLADADEWVPRIAAALHREAPELPVAALAACAAVLLTRAPEPLVAALADALAVPLLAGKRAIKGCPGEAGGRLDEAITALDLLARRGDGPGIVDLADHVFTALQPGPFMQVAGEAIGRGGAVVLVALGEFDRLQELAPRMVPQLELELFQVLVRAAGPDAAFLRASPGVIACALADAPAPILKDVAAQWRERGPIGNGVVQVERSMSASIVPAEGLAQLDKRAAELARGFVSRFEALPLPLALSVRAGYAANTPLARMTALFSLVEACSRFVPAALACTATQRTSSGRLPVVRPREEPVTAWLSSWWALAAAAGRTLDEAMGPVAELLRVWLRANGEPAPWVADVLQLTAELRGHLARRPGDVAYAQRELPRIEQALTGLVERIHGLGGWTLIAVDRVDHLDLERGVVTITYIDYTGSFEGGTSRKITLQSSLAIGHFVYLMRFGEGIAIPLEPFLRRRSCPTCGAEELFLIDDPVYAPGVHAYHSVHTDHPLEEAVTEVQIPPGLRT